ncbi:MAG: hypothetical protein E7379_01565 [Clostridiales bacterium]|nr:hypothetical protein [Clostridiales bacterium]
MKKLSILIQEIIKLIIFFIVSLVWLNSYLYDKAFAISLAIAISLTLEVITLFISREKLAKKNLKAAQLKDAENMFFSLATDKNATDFFFNLFSTRYKTINQLKDYLILEEQDGKKTLFYPFLKISTLEIDDIFSISKLSDEVDKIIIACNDFSVTCKQYKLKKEIIILNKYDTYNKIFTEYEYYPQVANVPKQNNFSCKNLFNTIFNKSKTKGYLFAGLILLISSSYIPYNIYYKLTATILLLFASICLLFPQNKSKKELV